jgi:hypothetical protein
MQLVTRAQWGARPPKQRQLLVKHDQRGTAVHYSGSDADELADHSRCARRVRSIQDFHMDGRGWSDIAYSYLACKHGTVYEGRGRGIRTAAQGTNAGNDGYHAVCFLGDDTANRDDVTDLGRAAIKDAVHWCNAWAGVAGVRPHSSFHSTGCPGDDLRAWIAAGMPVHEEDDMALSDQDKDWFSTKLEASERRTARYVDHGNVDTPGTNDHHERIRADISNLAAAVGARLDAIEELLSKPPA